MSVPRRRLSRARTHKRQAGKVSQSSVKLDSCTSCNRARRAHRACVFCGFYKNDQKVKV